MANENNLPTKSEQNKTESKYSFAQFFMVITIGIAIGLAIGLGGFQVMEDDKAQNEKPVKSAYGIYKHAAVASDHKICSDIGRDIMALHGGNAIDAAIAVALCSGVLHTQSIGLGGGTLATIYHKKHGIKIIDARELAPLAAPPNILKTGFKDKSLTGPRTICVPGLLKGYIEMHSKFGSIPWKTLFPPIIKLLREGFPLTDQSYAGLIRNLSPQKESFKGFEMFLDENNLIKAPGSIIRMPKLADTMERVADDPKSFYDGSLAQDIVNDVQEEGGIMTLEDLKQYQAFLKEPTKLDLPGDLTLYSVPSPGAGPSLSYLMSILSGYNMTAESFATDEAKILTYHRLTEAMKFSYARKTGLGDERFVDVKELVKNLTSRAYGDLTRARIDDSRTFGLSYYDPKFYGSKQHGTSHSAVIDKDGNAVAITGSIGLYFGSQVVGRRTGVIFNNEMIDFSHAFLSKYPGLQPAEPNFIQPGKRPLSAMCPSIIWDNAKNKVSIIAGGAGGHKIQAAVAFNLMGLLWFNMSVPEALDQPRVLHELLPMDIQPESHLPPAVKVGLAAKGHTFIKPQGITVIQMIRVLEDSIIAGCDYRKRGEPSGF